MSEKITRTHKGSVGKNLPKHMRRYLTRLGLSLSFYSVMLGGSIVATNKLVLSFPIKVSLSILTAAPVLFIIWAIGELLADEKMDEFERMIMVRCGLYSTGLVLAVATVWGFLESFAEVQGLPLFMMFPLFWFFFGLVLPLVRRQFK